MPILESFIAESHRLLDGRSILEVLMQGSKIGLEDLEFINFGGSAYWFALYRLQLKLDLPPGVFPRMRDIHCEPLISGRCQRRGRRRSSSQGP